MRSLGELERAVLLTVVAQDGQGYGVSIRRELQTRLRRPLSLGAIYTTLDRLETKGLVSSRYGDPTPERGGRAKKFFRIEAKGRQALDHARKASDAIWALAAEEAK